MEEIYFAFQTIWTIFKIATLAIIGIGSYVMLTYLGKK